MLTVRQTLVAAAAAALLLPSACGSGGSQQNQSGNAANAAKEQTVPTLPIPTPEPPMNREQLLIATLRAASDYATGVDDAKLQTALAGKKFEFRIRFGCDGPYKDDSKEAFDWTYNLQTRALKVRATPALSPEDAPVKAIAGDAFETVEGFWLRRPWLLTPACPRQDEVAAAEEVAAATAKPAKAAKAEVPSSPPSQMVGIAQFFTATGPRTMRRSGRPYEATKRLETDQPPAGGFDLVLSGRLVALPNGRVIACTRWETGDRPACLISVEFGKVSIERADTHEQLAQWGSG